MLLPDLSQHKLPEGFGVDGDKQCALPSIIELKALCQLEDDHDGPHEFRGYIDGLFIAFMWNE